MVISSSFLGYACTIVSAVCFGSFAVPVKSERCKSVNVHPLVFQTYKTAMCFLTSWFVLLYHDVDFTISPWGLVSGLFWVPGGILAIHAVKMAGLAFPQGLWSSLIVLVSFIWGIFVFHESVKSTWGAVGGVLGMMAGLLGMAFFSGLSLERSKDKDKDKEDGVTSSGKRSGAGPNESVYDTEVQPSPYDPYQSLLLKDVSNGAPPPSPVGPYGGRQSSLTCRQPPPSRSLFGGRVTVSNRTEGILSAVFCGLWGGSVMVPMHYSDVPSGLGYVSTFAFGASAVTIAIWIGYWLLGSLPVEGDNYVNFGRGWQSLPSMHWRVMLAPGSLAGLLWSIGNVSSMVAVSNLGEGVGYSLCQSSMLVSGLWGLFYYKEIKGTWIIAGWLACALVTIGGIVFLSFMHKDEDGDGDDDSGGEGPGRI